MLSIDNALYLWVERAAAYYNLQLRNYWQYQQPNKHHFWNDSRSFFSLSLAWTKQNNIMFNLSKTIAMIVGSVNNIDINSILKNFFTSDLDKKCL